MKSLWKLRIMAAMLVIAVCGLGTLFAQDTLVSATTPVASLVNKNTFVYARIDVKGIDIDKTVANWKLLVADIFAKVKADQQITKILAEAGDEFDLDAIKDEYFQQLDVTASLLQSRLDTLLATGLKEVYVLANSRVMMMAPVRIVVTFEKNGKPDAFLALLKEYNPYGFDMLHIEKRDDMVLLSQPIAGLDMSNPSDKARLQRMFDAIKPEENPALAAGLERVKSAPIQVVYAPDSSIHGLVALRLGAAPEPLNKFGGKTLTDGVQWAAAGLDPVRQIFALSIQSASPEAAQKLYDTVEEAFDVMTAPLTMMAPDMEPRWDALKTIIPKVNGSRLQLVVNKQFLESQMESLTAVGIAMLPAIQANQVSAKRMQCTNNIKQIVLALHNYHDAYRQFPPVMTADANGKPLHSWRVLILPFIEQNALYSQIRLNEPWDSEHNKQFHDEVPRVYQCPDAITDRFGMTIYSVVVGKECFFNEPNAKRNISAIVDGTSNTIAIVERKTPVCWMDPTQEITFAKACEGINVSANGLGSNHTGGMNVGLFDGSVHFISETINLNILRALFTCAGGESVAMP